MGCIVSKLFLDFYIFFIFTRPLNQFYSCLGQQGKTNFYVKKMFNFVRTFDSS